MGSSKPLIVQYNNVCWNGGTFGAAVDLARALPEFRHKIMIKHDSINWIVKSRAERFGIEVGHLPQMTKKFLDHNNPYTLIMNNPGAGSYEAINPTDQFYDGYKWLMDYPILTYHHSAIHPWFPTRSHIFCSNYLRLKYRNLWEKMDCMEIVPPCINTEDYSFKGLVPIHGRDDKLHIGIVMDKEEKKFPPKFVEQILEVLKPYRAVIQVDIVNGPFDCTDYDFVNRIPSLSDLINYFSDIDVFIHTPRIPDTWGRTLTEAIASGCYAIIAGEGGMHEQMFGNRYGYNLGVDEPIKELERWAGRFIETINKKPIRWFLNRGQSYIHAKSVGGYDLLRQRLIPILLRVHTGYRDVISV